MEIIMGNEKDLFWKSIPVILIRDERLSFQARAVAIFLLSMSAKWEFRALSLPFLLKCTNNSQGHLGRDATRKIIKELEACGYLIRNKFRNGDGKWVWKTIFVPLAASGCLIESQSEKTSHVKSNTGSTVGDTPGGKSSSIKEGNLNEETLLHTESSKVVVDFPQKIIEIEQLNLDLTNPLLRHYSPIIEQVWLKYKEQISIEKMQLIVDELTGVLSASMRGLHPEIRSKRGWLRAVVKSMLNDEFTAEYGIGISKNRLNLSNSKSALPEEKIDVNDAESREKSKEYQRKQLQKIKLIIARNGHGKPH